VAAGKEQINGELGIVNSELGFMGVGKGKSEAGFEQMTTATEFTVSVELESQFDIQLFEC